MSEFMPPRLRSTILPVTGINEDASTNSVVVCKQSGNFRIQLAAIKPHPELQLHERKQILDRTLTKSEPGPQALRIMFCLGSYVTRENRLFWRIIMGPLDTENVLKLDLSPDEII